MPPMLLSIITDTIAAQRDLDIVGRFGRALGLVETAERIDADVVVVARTGADNPAEYDELLYRHSRLKVIEIFGEGRYGTLYELHRRHLPLGEMSPPQLVDAIRAAVSGTARAGP